MGGCEPDHGHDCERASDDCEPGSGTRREDRDVDARVVASVGDGAQPASRHLDRWSGLGQAVGHTSRQGADAAKSFSQWANGIVVQLRDSLPSASPFKVALVELNTDFSYEVKYEFENPQRWAISKLNGRSGLPAEH